MPKYPEERKQAILRKMAPPHSMSVAELTIEEGISDATLYNWRKRAREEGAILPSNSAVPEKWSSEEKFRAVLQTVSMTQAELSEYCRQHGLYPEQIKAWKAACVAGNDRADQQARHTRQAVRADKRRLKKLESELRRKDKALAETAALLTLSKKSRGDLGPQRRGRMTSLPDRQEAVALIEDAHCHGARLDKACEVLNLSVRTYQRWTPSKQYSKDERDAMVALCNQPEYRSRPPAYIVADQLDQGQYVASESTLYRVLREHDQLTPQRPTESATAGAPAHNASSQCAQPAVVVGYHVVAGPGTRHVVLPVPDHGYL